MVMETSDLTARARIRNAALEGFARRGAAATSTREIARAAGVSPGLVQHHFPTKDSLRAAIDDHVVKVAEAAFSGLSETSTLIESLEELGERVSRFVREEPDALLYVARAALQGEDAGLRSFDAFVAIADAQWRRLADDGLLDAEVDLPWAALHVTIINLGTVLFAEAVSRHLPDSFSTPEQVDRWRAATVALFDRGLSRRASRARPQRTAPEGIPNPVEAANSYAGGSEGGRP
jgi:AcrR family transcriptional regulator